MVFITAVKIIDQNNTKYFTVIMILNLYTMNMIEREAR